MPSYYKRHLSRLFAMRNVLFLKFKPALIRGFNFAKCVTIWIASALILFISLTVLFGLIGPLSAQEQNPPTKQNPAGKLHDPFPGKDCSDCHRRVVSSKVNCLLAKEDLCEFCHQVPEQGGPARFVETSKPLCFKCHKEDEFKGRYVHGPSAAGACTTCHDPHGGDAPGMLRITGPQMCLKCHQDMNAQFINARFRHKATMTGCLDCHSPHRSEQRYLLKSEVPQLCGRCHGNIDRDLHTEVRHSPATEGSACMNCHDPHMAQESGLLLADGLDICLKCHDKPVKDKDKKLEFADMKKILSANPYPHGPIQNRNCSECHNPHGSPYSRLLTNQYPQGFYAPFFTSNYDLCFRCHEPALATEERTITATEFRDGDRNLHFVHVNKASHGRTCRSCHEVHASTNPEHIAATVPFGDWELPVKFEKTENGGSCTSGCHAFQKYGRQPATPGKR
jgi:predicted CXXCH cytochrome family protein